MKNQLDKDLIPQELFPKNVVLCGYRGSVSHGTYIPSNTDHGTDDVDVIGAYIAPVEYYIGLGRGKIYRSAIEKFIGQYDGVFYELRKYIKLLLASNPNVLSLLWLKKEHYITVTPLGQQLIDNRDAFLSKNHVYNAFTGYAHSQLKRMTHFKTEGYMGKKRKKLVEKFGYDCYDEETTEFLTDSGWKKFDDVNDNDKLGTVNIISNDFEFQKYISKTDKLHTGYMYIIEPYLNKCIVTPNHNLLVSPAHRNRKNNYSIKYEEAGADWKLLSVKDAIDGYRSVFHYRRTAVPTNEEYEVEDSYLELAGLYISDGNSAFRNGEFKSIKFTQSKSNNGFYDIANSLTDIYPIRRYDYKKETIWILHGDVAHRIYNDFGHRKEKKLPNWCLKLSHRQAEILWKSLMLGDGHNKREYDVYYTSLPKLADNIQAMLTVTGIFCVIDGPYPAQTSFGYVEMYHVVRSKLASKVHNIRFNQLLKHGNKVAKKRDGYTVKEIKVINKRVVCFETPNNTLITRNNGKVSIHGNCKNASHLIRLLHMAIEILNTGKVNVFRHDAKTLIDIKTGMWSLEQVKETAAILFKTARDAYENSTLPASPDSNKIEDILKIGLFNYLQKTPL